MTITESCERTLPSLSPYIKCPIKLCVIMYYVISKDRIASGRDNAITIACFLKLCLLLPSMPNVPVYTFHNSFFFLLKAGGHPNYPKFQSLFIITAILS